MWLMRTIIIIYSIINLMIVITACSNSNDTSTKPITNTTSPNAPKTTEYSVIELYADLSASPTFLEGIWESSCVANNLNNSFYKSRRVFHLDGVFREVASYNDVNCNIRNSRNTVRLFGTMSNIENIELYNGLGNIEVQKITSNLMSAPIRGMPIPLQNITLEDLTSHSTTIEAFSLVQNRLYITDDFGPNAYNLLGTQRNYLVNNSIDSNGKTESEIDQLAVNLFNPTDQIN